jgi:hypothetical protein
VSAEPTAPTPADTDDQQPTNNPAPPDPAPPAPTRPVTVGEIAEFLRHLTELRTSPNGGDPAERVGFLARKAELFDRLAAGPTSTPGPRPGTP